MFKKKRGQTRVVLGNEWDETLRSALRDSLESLGAVTGDRTWSLVGSQELSALDIRIKGQRVRVEAETYIGLTVIGPQDLVGMIKKLVSERVRRAADKVPAD